MTEYRSNLLTRMIHIYGFEHPVTIAFAKICEEAEDNVYNDRMLFLMVTAHEDSPVMD